MDSHHEHNQLSHIITSQRCIF